MYLRSQPRRRHRPRLTAALAAVALVSAICATSAAASGTVDTRSDHAALAAYRTYMHALVLGSGAAAKRDRTFAADVKSICGGSVSQSTIAQIGTAQAYAFGVEIGGDVSIYYDIGAGAPFNRLADGLLSLTWSQSSSITTISNYVTAERTLLTYSATSLCHDWLALGEHPRRTPAKTAAFDHAYAAASAAAHASQVALMNLFEKYEAAGDTALINAINSNVRRYSQAFQTARSATAKTIRRELGLYH